MPDRIDSLIAALTIEEKVELLTGADMWNSPAIDRVGVPGSRMTDGPNGARGGSFTEGLSAACFPCGSALGATWNPELIEEVGAAIAEEARTKGAHVLLAPTVNIHRSPLGGRSFECYSEDPCLSAGIAVGFVRGVQSRGVAACVKHFVCNDSEFERQSISSEVGERALREIYLVPFEAAVIDAGVWSIMSAYNKVNGTYASEHPRLLQGILRDEWGFDGCVISDWGGTYSTADAVNAGLDLEMPGPGQHRRALLLDAVEKGEVEEATLDERVRALLRTAERTGAFENPAGAEERVEDRPEHRAVARRAAVESAVLLRNEGDLLPLDPTQLRSLAVIGPNANTAVIHGGGSAQVRSHYAVKPLDAIRKRLGDGVDVTYEPGCSIERSVPAPPRSELVPASGEGPGLLAEFFEGSELEGSAVHTRIAADARQFFFGTIAPGIDVRSFSMRLSGTWTPSAGGPHTLGLIAVGRSRLLLDGELRVDAWTSPQPGDEFFGRAHAEERTDVTLEAGRPYEIVIEYAAGGLPLAGLSWGGAPAVPADGIERAVAAAAGADAAVIIAGTNGAWETEGRDRDNMDLPGDQDELIRRVVAANPRTAVVLNAGSPLRLDWVDEVPSILQVWFPGQECGNAISDVVFGDAAPGGRLPMTVPVRLEDTPAFINYPGENGQVQYGEGIFVGYRYYDARDVTPRFPFGHGLAYTRFEYGGLIAEPRGEGVHVEVEVANTGSRVGQEVVQLYLRDVESSLVRPPQELRAFRKLELQPGERSTVAFDLDRRALSYYDPALPGWVAEAGEFEIRVGASSRDIRARASVSLDDL